MMTRLILVGMVAALGITVPTWPQIQGWVGVLHSWTSGQLEAWDVLRSGGTESVVSAPLARRPRPVVEPIEPDETTSAVAYELNRISEGLDLRPTPTIAARMPVNKRTVSPASGRGGCSRIPCVAASELELLAKLRQVLEQADAQIERVEIPAGPRRTKALIDPPFVCVLTASPAIAAPVHAVTAAPVETGPFPRTCRTESDLASALATTHPEIASGQGYFFREIERLRPGQVSASGTPPAFEPIDPALTASASLADALNRTSEGVTLALAEPGGDHPRVSAADSRRQTVRLAAGEGGSRKPTAPSGEVAQAMRLTRDAVHAWVKVMSGPASIQVSAR